MIFAARSESIPELWDVILPHLERFSRETMLTTPADILCDLMSGEKQLWLVEKNAQVVAVGLTQIYLTGRGNICAVWGACGDLGIEGLREALEEIERWAMSINCVAMEIRGRKGWVRALPEFKQTGVLLEKDLRRMH